MAHTVDDGDTVFVSVQEIAGVDFHVVDVHRGADVIDAWPPVGDDQAACASRRAELRPATA
jgi:hypothetical protein